MTGLLTLDLASSTGWAAWSHNRGLASGSIKLPSTGERVGAFLVAYEKWLCVALDEWLPDWVVFEAPILPEKTQIHTVRKLCGLANSTEVICDRRELYCREVNSSSVRKHFCGFGRAPKEIKGAARRKWIKAKVIEACRERGWNPANDDEADALAILDHAAHVLKLPVDWACGELFKGAA